MLFGKRDFTNESVFNLIHRIKRSFLIRLRGFIFALFGTFARGSSIFITFGSNPRFMNSKWIKIEKNAGFGYLCRIECYESPILESNNSTPKICIGENTSFGDFVHIGAINGVSIGKNVLGASKILIIDHDHGKAGKYLESYTNVPPTKRELISKGKIIIEDNVWIGESVVILAGSFIGKGSIIAANSLVKGIVPPFTVYVNK
jgi:acetyltransferase-like isoleucine patch superfamily enzyme